MQSAVHELSLRHYGRSRGSHSHEHFQVLVGVAGVLELEVEGRGQRVAAGEGLVVAPGARHDFESPAGSRCLVLDTSDDVWARCRPTPAGREELAALARYLAAAIERRGAPAHAAGLLLDAWLPEQPMRARVRREIDWGALSQWLQSNLQAPLSLADLAARVHLSPSQFAARCLEANGLGAMAWLRAQRLERARQLRAAGLNVAETARQCGYRSPSALTAAMKRVLR